MSTAERTAHLRYERTEQVLKAVHLAADGALDASGHGGPIPHIQLVRPGHDLRLHDLQRLRTSQPGEHERLPQSDRCQVRSNVSARNSGCLFLGINCLTAALCRWVF